MKTIEKIMNYELIKIEYWESKLDLKLGAVLAGLAIYGSYKLIEHAI